MEGFLAAVDKSTEIAVQKLADDMLHVSVIGVLSFHRVTHTHSFDARVTTMGTMLRISGEFSPSPVGLRN